ncbi:50S ribosomal protein L25/general stress protein Ctc [Thioalkalivibrio sp. XN8]|uniref:50S ribosomal protein L25/general stress protein Ctc n=1 Tax=Thioalkalivibrio sp. XN8 TaxID=2712863 RepID=UPI0013EE2F66|nr:50S ribosomal protein L25/general stress protein Ctc [Thioalkalivibrio sp. XN8]NGP54173.1 50S ribosomal protein L25/general stress protein Ctc [Thioalkalivibrio sp. XN8]
MSQKFELFAEDRPDQGKGASRRLRRTGKVPAILYGAHRDPRALALDHNALLHQLENEAFFSSILTVTTGDKSQPCILKDVQRHPYKNQVLHVDLQRVLEDEEIRVTVPFHFLGEDTAPGVKGGGVVSRVMTELEITCLPKHLPEYIDVDVSKLELEVALTLGEVALPEGVSIYGGEEMLEQPVFIIHRPRREEEIEGEGEGEGETPPGEVPTTTGEPEED